VFDLHVHSAPCVFPRLADDAETVSWYERAGFRGCVLKGHYEPTAGRAATAGAGRRLAVLGGIVLNRPVGGFNPAAVAAALELGARIVWMPTLDTQAHLDAGLARPRSAAAGGLSVRGAEGDVREILRLVADADAVLATGHLSGAEAAWLVREARAAGVGRILLTHPSFVVPALTPREARELVELGAVAEVTAFQLLHQDGCGAAELAAFVREVGPERCVLSSDGGQPDSPPAPEALHLLAEALAREGLDRGALDAMASELPERLACP
jgi:hypothetical protein